MEYRVYVPVEGWLIYTVDANSEDEAKDKVLEGEFDSVDVEQGGLDDDKNNWGVERC